MLEQLMTADGETLEAELHQCDGEPKAVVIATHPHPLYGGDMTNTAPALLCRTVPSRSSRKR